MGKTDGLKQSEYLSLVSKVCSELETNLGYGDKVVAEFIIEIGQNCENVTEFDSIFKKFDFEMPDYFVKTLLTMIHAIVPPSKPKSSDKKEFSALSSKDGKESVRELERETEEDARSRKVVREEEDFDRRDAGRDRRRE